jgi:hypothetical protein
MTEFFWGALIMYLLGIILHMDMLDSTDEEGDPNAPIRFALLWPYVALMVIFYKVVGLDDGEDENK